MVTPEVSEASVVAALSAGIEFKPIAPGDYDKASDRVGGAFRLSVLLQKRVRELVRGARPLVPVTPVDSPIDIALREVLEEKVEMVAPGTTAERLIAAVERGAKAEAAAVEATAEATGGAEEKETATKKKAKKKAAAKKKIKKT